MAGTTNSWEQDNGRGAVDPQRAYRAINLPRLIPSHLPRIAILVSSEESPKFVNRLLSPSQSPMRTGFERL